MYETIDGAIGEDVVAGEWGKPPFFELMALGACILIALYWWMTR